MMGSFEWKAAFIGKPKLREKRDGVKIWDVTMTPYPRHMFHMKRLRFPYEDGWGTIEAAAGELLMSQGLSKSLHFGGNIPWRYYQNHFNETPEDEIVIGLDQFVRKNRLGREKLRRLLKKYKFRGLPDLVGGHGNRYDVWEVKAPLDSHDIQKALPILVELAEFGFSANLLFIHEFGKTKADLSSERKKHLSKAEDAYSQLLNSVVGKKVFEHIIKPTLEVTLDLNSVNRIFSKYESGVSYFVYALVYYIERVGSIHDYKRAMSVFTLTQAEIISLSRQLFESGSYHWWRIPILLMQLIEDEAYNEEYVELLKAATEWENKFKTSEDLHALGNGLDVSFFEDYYNSVIVRNVPAHRKSLTRIKSMRYQWWRLYDSRPLR